jgi:opacity protein-like surface antigen
VNKSAGFLIMASSVLGATAALAGNYDGSYDGGGYRDHRRVAREMDYSSYVGLSIGQLRYHEDGLNSITPAAALLRIGAPLGSNLAIEARAGAGFGDASTDGYRMTVQSLYGGYLKGSLPLAPGFSFYALGGVAAVNLQRDFGLEDAHDTGLSFGLGADFDLSGGATLNIEWTRLPGGDNLGYDYSNDMASIGVAWHF